MKREFTYNILPRNDSDMFYELCNRVEKHYPNIKKLKLAIDVDGTLIQVYQMGNKEIVVFDDYEVGAVYIESDIELSKKITFVKDAA